MAIQEMINAVDTSKPVDFSTTQKPSIKSIRDNFVSLKAAAQGLLDLVGTLSSPSLSSLILTGIDFSVSAAIVATDNALVALGKLQAQISLRATINSPALTGVPTAPTAIAGTNTTQISTTAFVAQAIADLVGSSPSALDTLNELAAALGNDANFASTVTTALAGKQAGSALLSAIAALTPTDGAVVAGNGTTFVTRSDFATLAGNTFAGAQILGDNTVSSAHFVDCGIVSFAKGTINSTSTVTFDYTQGHVQTLMCGGAYTLTWAFSNWPPSSNKGFFEIQVTNMGLGTLAFSSTINWKNKDDTYTTSFATYLTDRGGETSLKTGGLDTFLFWSQDEGITIYGALL